MIETEYKGACDGLIKTLYHFLNNNLETQESRLHITEKQKKVLQGLASKILETLDEAEIISCEALGSPTKEKI